MAGTWAAQIGSFGVGKCPHERIEHCPLYVAAHEAGGYGCDDGKLGDHEGCAVDRGVDYGRAVARLCDANRELVQECAEREGFYLKMEQRRRNRLLNGIH